MPQNTTQTYLAPKVCAGQLVFHYLSLSHHGNCAFVLHSIQDHQQRCAVMGKIEDKQLHAVFVTRRKTSVDKQFHAVFVRALRKADAQEGKQST